jgi:hypothetical protein
MDYPLPLGRITLPAGFQERTLSRAPVGKTCLTASCRASQRQGPPGSKGYV